MDIPAMRRTLSNPGSRWGLIFVACLLLISGLTAFAGVVPVIVFGHDEFIWLEDAWRLWRGQRPHVDFCSALGPGSFLIVWLGFLLSHALPNGI